MMLTQWNQRFDKLAALSLSKGDIWKIREAINLGRRLKAMTLHAEHGTVNLWTQTDQMSNPYI